MNSYKKFIAAKEAARTLQKAKRSIRQRLKGQDTKQKSWKKDTAEKTTFSAQEEDQVLIW